MFAFRPFGRDQADISEDALEHLQRERIAEPALVVLEAKILLLVQHRMRWRVDTRRRCIRRVMLRARLLLMSPRVRVR